jgi:membrane-associated protease RseP (regulator of RpoE activity)
MQPQQSFSGPDQSGAVVCAQCGAPMPKEMRFCRSCGNRLGEGPAEYTETVRLPNAQTGPGASATTPFYAAPMAQRGTSAVYYPRKRRMRGMTWVWIAIAIFFASGGGLSMLVKNVGKIPRTVATAAVSRSYAGVDQFRTADGGVSFDYAKPPGGPADQAGLVGGDIITSIDGRVVKSQDDIMAMLRATPIGKTVEVLYLRDGEPKKTQLTTISEDQLDELSTAYSNRSGRGKFGYDNDKTSRVLIPGTKVYGVQLDSLEDGEPAQRAGVKEGDIVIEFGGVPIRTEEEFLSRVRRAEPYSTVKVVVIRGGQRVEIPVNLGRN